MLARSSSVGQREVNRPRRKANRAAKVHTAAFLWTIWLFVPAAPAFQEPARNRQPDIDKAREQKSAKVPHSFLEHDGDIAKLKRRLPSAMMDMDPVTGGPRWIRATDGFLTGANGKGRGLADTAGQTLAADDLHRPTKAFLLEYRALFGHGPEALVSARIKREFTTPHSGMRTVVWEQQLDDIPIFGGTLISHTTKNGELVNIGSRFMSDPEQAANKAASHARARQEAPLSGRAAVVLSARNLGETLDEPDVIRLGDGRPGSEQKQRFRAPQLRGDAHAHLVWLPMSRDELRLCWDIILTSRARGEMFRMLIDAQSGEVLVRHCLTYYLSDFSLRVFTSDSPSPFSPGWPTPNSGQPLLTTRSVVSLSAVNTNASPLGWIDEGGNETLGNNVDAHLDRDADDAPDLPRPHGLPARNFDFPLDLAQDPSTYGDASVVQAFYRNNWMHDRLYELGFTEAAGNFQTTNFARGGVGGDALLAQSQDGSDTDNANISVPPDGIAPLMQMFLFIDGTPARDASFDAEIMLHEYTHGLSNRRVGDGDGLFALQSQGMGEGWSDFYALALLGEPGDDVNGAYAAGGYSTYLLGGLMENYYFGIRRYPYSTDLSKNPLTFADIDPSQADLHAGIPISPITGGRDPAEVHAQGEVWCVTLWEARANLIRKHGFTTGDELILRLVTDGMNLSPPDPTFTEARDAILQADRVLTGGANQQELWTAFAKRGMGIFAVAPSSDTTLGVEQSFDVPGDLGILPGRDAFARGPAGGPLTPPSQTYTLTNTATNTITWSASTTAEWLAVSGTNGTLLAHGSMDVIASLAPAAYALTAGVYTATVTFSNQVTGKTQVRRFTLNVGLLDYFTQFFDNASREFDLAYSTLTFVPDGSANSYFACREPATSLPTDTSDGERYEFKGSYGAPEVDLPQDAEVFIYGKGYRALFLGAGFIQLTSNFRTIYDPNNLAAEHFGQPHITAFAWSQAAWNTIATWKVLKDRFAVTFHTFVPLGVDIQAQIELFFDGRIRVTFLQAFFPPCDILPCPGTVVGLAQGVNVTGFEPSDLSAYGPCLHLMVPPHAREGDGTLAGQGLVTLPYASLSNVNVRLDSSSPANVRVTNQIIVPAGQREANFDLRIIDDSLLDGTQPAVITASTPRFGVAEATILAEDNETAILSLSLPASAIEREGGAIIQGTVSMNAVPASDILVALSSSDTTELAPQQSTIIRAGQTSAVFTVNVLDDAEVDGSQTAIITAHVANWQDGTAAVTVLDNETPTLGFTVPPEVCEGAVTMFQAGLLSLGGIATSNVTLALSSSDTNRLRVQPMMLIPLGQSSGRFDLTLLDNSSPEALETVTLTATAPGWLTGIGSLLVRDDDTPTAPFNLVPEDGALGVSVQLRLTWQGELPPGESLVNGDFEMGDLSGWQVYVSIDTEDANFYINKGNFDPYGPDRPTPPYAGQYCAVGDQLGPSVISLYQQVAVPPCQGRVFLRWVDRIRNYAGSFIEDQRFWVQIDPVPPGLPFDPVQIYSTNPGDQLLNDWVEREVEITRFRGQSIQISFNVEATLNYLTIFIDNVSVMAQPTSSQIVYDVYLGTTPALGPANLVGTTTNTFLDTPPLAGATRHYWQVVAHNIGMTASAVQTFVTLGLDHFEWSIAPTQFVGQPFVATLRAKDALGRTVTNFASTATLTAVNASAGHVGEIVPNSLPGVVHFTNGVWSGVAQIDQIVPEMFLRAMGDFGIIGDSGHFTVLAPNDISLNVMPSADPAAVGELLTYRINITNTGPAVANGVTLSNLLPGSVTFSSVSAPDGNCTHEGNVVSCRFSAIQAQSQVTIEIIVRPESVGMITNYSVVARNEADFYLPNNAVRLVTSVQAPTLSIGDSSLTEGDPAERQQQFFTVTLSPPSSRPVSVQYATSDQTARADSDYLATNGMLVFNPGQTSKMVAVDILVDRAAEETETYAVTLFAPTNAVLGRSMGIGAITDTDPLADIIVGPASVREGATMLVPVSLTRASGKPVSISLATHDGTARALEDYLATNVDLVFAPGATSAVVRIVTLRDDLCEGAESLYLAAYNYTNIGFINASYLYILDGQTPSIIGLAEVRLTGEGSNPNGLIDPGEQATLAVTLRTLCDARLTNVIATLLPGNGVTQPSGPQSYGLVGPGQAPATRPFTFKAAGTNGAPLILTFDFRDGETFLNTQTFRLHLGPTPDFAIASLSTNGCDAIDISGLASENYFLPAGVAASASNLLYGAQGGLAAFPWGNLRSGGLTSYRRDGLVSNLRTETIYVLGVGDAEAQLGDAYLTTLLEVDGATGAFTGNRVHLDRSIEVGAFDWFLGLYSGYDRVVIHSASGDVFSISLPWGQVSQLGQLSQGTHLSTESRGYWGVAEHINGEDWLVYARDSRAIARKRVSDGFTKTVASFDNLGTMGAMTVSVPRGQWCFATTSASQFLNAAPTVGVCDATFTISEELRIASIGYENLTVTIRFSTIAGRLYRLECAGDLGRVDWTPVQADLVGTGGDMTVTQPATSFNRFYRLRVSP